MFDAVVLEYNGTTKEAVVETTDSISRRYRVPMSSSSWLFRITVPKSSDAADEERPRRLQSSEVGKNKGNYPDNLFHSTPVGRCVTIDPVDERDAGLADDKEGPKLPLARLVYLHESGLLASKSMLPGTITRVSGRFVFIFCSFLPYEAVATRDTFSTGGFLANVTSATATLLEQREDTSRPFSEEEEWVGRYVHFALYPMSFLVMEAFFTHNEGPRERKEAHRTLAARNISNRWFYPSGVPRLIYEQRREVGGLASLQCELADELNDGRLGVWSITGTDPCKFFQPELSLQFVQGATLLEDNAMPPILHQKSVFSLKLWSFWMLAGTQVSLRVLDEDRCDVTDHVLCIEREETEEGAAVTLDHLESKVVVSFRCQIKTFKMQGVVCEITFLLCIEQGDQKTQLESKPMFVRHSLKLRAGADIIGTGKQVPGNYDLSHKFWTSDVLGPEDNISTGFTDPGRSNELLTEDCYKELPMVEREIIVVDPEDTRLKEIAKVARRLVLGIVDTIVCTQVLACLVASACGGESGGINAEEEIIALRLQGRLNKRRRGRSSSNEGANVVRLGDVRNGVCRHRALLFKYLCDVVHLPCYLVRGEHQAPRDALAERHSWNIVPLEGRRHVLVDATLSPHKLEMWPVPAYKCAPVMLNSDWSHRHCMILHRSAAKIHLLEECGRGATAVVRRGVLAGGLTCVVKVPRTSLDLESLVYEYEVLRKFRMSSGVVRCLGWSGGIVMEYFPTNLLSFMNHLIIRETRMSLSQQKEVLIGLLSALKEVHTRGYVHRDIKAENVLLVVIRCSTCHSIGTVCHLCDVRVKLGDFADSVAVNPTTQIHMASPRVGTPPYAAPEIEAEAPFSFAADIWSCGVLAVEMASMQLPETSVSAGEEASVKCRNNDELIVQDGDDELRGVVSTITDDGKMVGPVRLPRLPQNPPPPRWQQELVEGALQVNWKQRRRAGALLDMLQGTSR
ncbi:putative Protein kinase domain [Trypanosoma rangeli]|uniref:Protein kinase domain-containing protein n=1 Tax=Trypanosoma rangeli TaxID=5698 RepID=A0A422N1T4_TRYRA|nr:putative Protein kinase domain [Trypanosoma rangeli]RNE99421.1 putative Protein kinase domain [Trypanosoma rangeli]|eukprot:RNE99421.1 putative Protein kinase domain [Trypanosoma rangeli]